MQFLHYLSLLLIKIDAKSIFQKMLGQSMHALPFKNLRRYVQSFVKYQMKYVKSLEDMYKVCIFSKNRYQRSE